MATATSKFRIGKRRLVIFILLGAAALALFWLILNFATLKGNARLGSSYAAHVTCSCRYIEGRSLSDCRKDKEAGMELVRISDDRANKRITAWVPFLASAMAERRGEFGCLQLTEEEIRALK